VDFEWSEEQEQLRESVRRFLETHADPARVRAWWEDPHGAPDEVWKGLCELGLPGLLVAEAHGGAGLGMLEAGVVLEELGRALHPGPFLASSVVATRLVAASVDGSQRAAWLSALASGSLRLAVALDAGAEPLRAVRDGARWRVSGEPGPVSDAAAAEAWLVPAEADGEVALFRVERGAAGAACERWDSVDGTRRLFRLALDGAPAERLAGDATQALEEARDLHAIALAADAVGAAGRALELSVDYAREREQFGRPIGSFQSLQHVLVDMLQDLELVRAATIHALWAADAAPPAERREAAAVAKAAAAEAFPRLGRAAIQVHGGIGFTWETDIHLFDKRLCSQALLGGGAALHLETLARAAIDRP